MPYAKYCMQDTGRIWHTVFCVVRDYIKLTKQMMTGMMNITYKKRKAGIRIPSSSSQIEVKNMPMHSFE